MNEDIEYPNACPLVIKISQQPWGLGRWIFKVTDTKSKTYRVWETSYFKCLLFIVAQVTTLIEDGNFDLNSGEYKNVR